MLSMSNQTFTTEHGTFSLNEKVIYSDLSPWEEAAVAEFRYSEEYQQDVVDLWFEGESQVCKGCMVDGLRKHTPENVTKYLSEEHVHTDAEIDELLA